MVRMFNVNGLSVTLDIRNFDICLLVAITFHFVVLVYFFLCFFIFCFLVLCYSFVTYFFLEISVCGIYTATTDIYTVSLYLSVTTVPPS